MQFGFLRILFETLLTRQLKQSVSYALYSKQWRWYAMFIDADVCKILNSKAYV